MTENLDGMSSEQLMLRDIIYELHDLVDDAVKEPDRMYRMGVFSIASLLKHQLET